jgi:hypothetical protein
MFDVVAALVEWLPGKLGVPAYSKVPAPRPSRFVTVTRTGGEAEKFLDRPTLAVQTWGESDLDAATLALTTRNALSRAAELEIPQICSCKVEAIYDFPDPDSSQSRQQLTVRATTRL